MTLRSNGSVSITDGLAEWAGRQNFPSDGVAPAGSWWLIPDSVSLEERSGEWVVIHRYSDLRKEGTPRDARGVLDHFLRLQNADASRVSRFIHDRGALLLDWRGVPRRGYTAVPGEMVDLVLPYCALARVVAAALRLGERARARKAPLVTDYDSINEHLRGVKRPHITTEQWTLMHPLREARSGRDLLIEFIDWWFVVGDVRPGIFFGWGQWQLAWSGMLWGVLGGQILQALVEGRTYPVCSGCGCEVRRERSPKSTQRIWCGKTKCERLRMRLAQCARRARKAR